MADNTWSTEDLNEARRLNPDLDRHNPELPALMGPSSKKPLKYRNKPTTDLDGEHYDSGLESKHARDFTLAVRAGEYVLYKHHVTFTLAGGVKIEVDHLVIDQQGKVHCFDSKALDKKTGKHRFHPGFKNKMKQFKEQTGIEIEII
jgi:hypothetical protein